MSKLRQSLDAADDLGEKLKLALPHIVGYLQVEDLYYVGRDGRMRAVADADFDEEAADIAELCREDVFSENTLEQVEKRSPDFCAALKKNGFESVMTVRVRRKDEVYGYLVCAVKRSMRIWQENECAILYYLAGLL